MAVPSLSRGYQQTPDRAGLTCSLLERRAGACAASSTSTAFRDLGPRGPGKGHHGGPLSLQVGRRLPLSRIYVGVGGGA